MKKSTKYLLLIIISLILCLITGYFGYKLLFNTPSNSNIINERIQENNYWQEWLDARYICPDLGVSQYKGEELEHLDRSQFADITELPYGIYVNKTTDEIIMNLDDVFKFVDNDADPSTIENCQERFIDKDYINKYFGDYGHHATKLFLNYFFNFDKADLIIVGGSVLQFDHYDTADAPTESWEVFLDETGEEQHYDDRIEFLTCVYNPNMEGTDRRFIAYMKMSDGNEFISNNEYDDQEIVKNSYGSSNNYFYILFFCFVFIWGYIFTTLILLYLEAKKDEKEESKKKFEITPDDIE